MSQAKYFRRAKSEWRSACSPGPSGPGFAKIAGATFPQPRLPLPNQRSRRNSGVSPKGLPYPNSEAFLEACRGGRLPLSRGRFPLSGGNGRRPKGVGMMSSVARQRGWGIAPPAGRSGTGPYEKPNPFRSRRPSEPHLSPARSKGALPTRRRNTQRLPEAQRQRS